MNKYYADTNIVDEKNPMSYGDCLTYIKKLMMLYPDLIDVSNAGFSRFKRLLPYIKVGLGEKQIFLCGAHHAREYISSTYLLKIIEEYLYCYKNNIMFEGYNLEILLNEYTLVIMPMVDPDGVYISQQPQEKGETITERRDIALIFSDISCYKANGVGVDLNRQYPALWALKENEIDYPASERYKGKAPATEPEVKAVMDLCLKSHFLFAVSFHSKGEIIFWADSNTGTEIKYAKGLADALSKVSSYEIIPPSQDPTYYAAGFENWFRQEFLRPGLLVELTPSDNSCVPYDDQDFYNLVWEKASTMVAEMMQFASDNIQ
jgi:g-D-glutamyl-meso-diaminopimelate peptidase